MLSIYDWLLYAVFAVFMLLALPFVAAHVADTWELDWGRDAAGVYQLNQEGGAR